ncbi:MAG: hypothetical protein ACRC33_30645 [Gemmataceae bacterium]
MDVMLISLDAVRAAGPQGLGAVPREWCRGVIDTGANTTALSPALIARMGILALGHGTTQAAGGSMRVGIYEVSLALTDRSQPALPTLSVPYLQVIDHAIPDTDVLVGMDILLECTLTLDGPARVLTLDF